MGRSFWGWGTDEARVQADEQARLGELLAAVFGIVSPGVDPPPTLAELDLIAPRVAVPGSLAASASNDPADRAAHTYGKAFRDVRRALSRRFDRPPDLVAFPRTEADVVAWLDWAGDVGASLIPFGGGSSVVGGVEAGRARWEDRPVVSLDLTHLDRVLEIDRTSRAARIQAGVLGPSLEDQLRPNGLTLRHFPQSFEFSSLGGWLATRAGGHYATGPTHIDDFVESIRAVTPSGVWESRRLPGSGAGPSPDRWLLGSEGTLGVITEAWMRLVDRPRFRSSASLRLDGFARGLDAVRLIAQAGLWPSNCRLIDATESLVSGSGDGTSDLLLVGFESSDHPVGALLDRALELVVGEGVTVAERTDRAEDESSDGARVDGGRGSGSAETWRSAFLRAPYSRDALVGLGLVVETFETAITWDRADEFCHRIREVTVHALREVGAWPGIVTCRVTHCYPDGVAPYFTVIASGASGRQLDQWDAVKIAVMEIIAAERGTVTHHHAVGRDHRHGYDRQRPEPFAAALAAAKAAVDPAGLLNPGVLIDVP